MTATRLRMIAGPNGSGKTTLLNDLKKKFPLGYCLNPDLLEQNLAATGRLQFADWGLAVDPVSLNQFVSTHPLAARENAANFSLRENILLIRPSCVRGYFTAILADFMRLQWLAQNESFTFETVMSDKSKVELLLQARAAEYRTYLYYICTESPMINVERVAGRVRQGGHPVPERKINSRFIRSLALLKAAVAASTRAYVFDNSGRNYRLIGEFENSRLIQAAQDLPNWFVDALLHS